MNLKKKAYVTHTELTVKLLPSLHLKGNRCLIIFIADSNQAQFLFFSCFQAFTVVTVFNSMTFALKVTPFSVKSLSEASVAVDRFKVSGSLPLLHVRSHPWQTQQLPLSQWATRGWPYLVFVHL